MNRFNTHIKLKHLIISVVALAFVLTITSNYFSIHYLNREMLKENTLETNHVYVEKIAKTADMYIEQTLKMLTYSADELADKMDDENALTEVATRLQAQNDTFNSVAIVKPDGLIVAGAPAKYNLKGVRVTSQEGLKALKQKKQYVSMPYIAGTGKYMITLSEPIFSEADEYLGEISCTIYLHENNLFNVLLEKHFYDDGSYVYVVDRDGRIIYHRDMERVGEMVIENEVVQHVTRGESGMQLVTNTKGIKMLAAYSPIESTNWGVISQRPLDVTIRPAGELGFKMFLSTIPLLVLSIFIVLFAANRIAKPLQRLALITESSSKNNEEQALKQVDGWYYEAFQLKNALLNSLSTLYEQVDLLKDQSTIDPLTGLMNRRAMDALLKQWTLEKLAYAVVMVDLDGFKKVNDTYGHAVGDEVLKFLANIMQEVMREQDICCRYGGEEFVILMPGTSQEIAFHMVERLRRIMESTDSPCGRPVTLSAGVAVFSETMRDPAIVLAMADKALYEAKTSGRNRVMIDRS